MFLTEQEDLPSLTFTGVGAEVEPIQDTEIIYLNEIPR